MTGPDDKSALVERYFLLALIVLLLVWVGYSFMALGRHHKDIRPDAPRPSETMP